MMMGIWTIRKMNILKIPALAALSLMVLSACSSDEVYHREMEEVYRAECAKRGQGGAGAFDACRKALIEERDKKWQERIEEKKRKEKERREKDAEVNR